MEHDVSDCMVTSYAYKTRKLLCNCTFLPFTNQLCVMMMKTIASQLVKAGSPVIRALAKHRQNDGYNFNV